MRTKMQKRFCVRCERMIKSKYYIFNKECRIVNPYNILKLFEHPSAFKEVRTTKESRSTNRRNKLIITI